MYVVLSVIILFSLWMLQALGQKISGPQAAPTSSDDQLRRHLQMREEMHKRIRDKLMYGVGSDADLFQGMDQMMEEAFSDSFSGFTSLAEKGPAMKMDWTETTTGRTLMITPEDPSQKIDLDVNNEMITIKGETKVKSQNGTSMSSFSNSFPVPQDCDGSRVKMSNKDGKIVMEFPYRKAKPIQKETRIPLPPTGEEVTI